MLDLWGGGAVIEYKDSKCSQEQKQRARVLREVVATEQTYVQSLYQCIKFFLVPLKEKTKDNRWIMTLEDVHRLFSTIEVIHQFNAEFSQQLDKRMAEWPNVNTFGDIFLQMVRRHTPLPEGLPTAPRSLYLHHSPSRLLGAHDENVHDLHQRIRRRHRRMDQVQRQARVCRLYRGTRTVLMGVCG